MSREVTQEELVAYLDGELADEAVARVEQSLVDDPAVRYQVEQLTKAEELLDLLPPAKASAEFTEKTLTAIRTQPVSEEASSEGGPTANGPANGSANDRGGLSRFLSKWGVRAVGFLGLLIVASLGFNAGFNAGYRRGPEPVDQLLNDYPVIRHLDEYRQAGDVEFLRRLNESGILDEPAEPEQN